MKILTSTIFFLFSSYLSAQTISEKMIANLQDIDNIDSYSFHYDAQSGTYIYSYFDTTSKKSSIYSNKGNSEEFDFIYNYTVIFDSKGNYYVVAGNDLGASVYSNILLKNGQYLAEYKIIRDGWRIKDDKLYYAATRDTQNFFITYDIALNSFTEFGPYDEIELVYYPEELVEGEPVGEVGFTQEGAPYYLAGKNNENFIVIGKTELKHYADIEAYTVTLDKKGQFTYFAKSSGKFYEEKGNTFLVQGDKEYKKFDYLYVPILFTKDNEPVYISMDSVAGKYIHRVMTGNKEGKAYDGGTYNLMFTQSGKLAYIAYSQIPGEENVFNTYIVLNGKEIASYRNLYNLSFFDNKPLFTASNDDLNYFVVYGSKKMSESYPHISYNTILPDGELGYIALYWGDYERKIPDKVYVFLGDEKFGPFEGVMILDWKKSDYITADNEGNHAFLTQKCIDQTNYIYKQKLYANKFRSKEYSYIEHVNLYNGKFYYFGGDYNPQTSISKYEFFCDKKLLSNVYEGIVDFNLDSEKGKIKFIGLKGKKFYLVDVTL